MKNLVSSKILVFISASTLILFSESDLFYPFGIFTIIGLLILSNYLERQYIQKNTNKERVLGAMMFLVVLRVMIHMDQDIFVIIANDSIVLIGLLIGYVVYSYLDIQEKLSIEIGRAG